VHAQGIKIVQAVARGQQAARDVNPGFGIVIAEIRSRHRHRLTCHDIPDQRNGEERVSEGRYCALYVLHYAAIAGFEQVDTARNIAFPLDVIHFLELVQVIINHRSRTDLSVVANLADRGRIAVVGQEGFQEGQYFLMSGAEPVAFSCHSCLPFSIVPFQ